MNLALSAALLLALACGAAEQDSGDADTGASAMEVAKARCIELIEAGRFADAVDACAEALREAPRSPEVAAALARASEGVAKAAAIAAEMTREAAERAEDVAEEAAEVAAQKAEQAADAAEEAIDAADEAADDAARDLRDGVDDLRN
jgi:methyl-accepting chemotaxis protein